MTEASLSIDVDGVVDDGGLFSRMACLLPSCSFKVLRVWPRVGLGVKGIVTPVLLNGEGFRESFLAGVSPSRSSGSFLENGNMHRQ